MSIIPASQTRALIFTRAVTFLAFLIVVAGIAYTLFGIIELLTDKQLGAFAEHLLFLVAALVTVTILNYGHAFNSLSV